MPEGISFDMDFPGEAVGADAAIAAAVQEASDSSDGVADQESGSGDVEKDERVNLLSLGPNDEGEESEGDPAKARNSSELGAEEFSGVGGVIGDLLDHEGKAGAEDADDEGDDGTVNEFVGIYAVFCSAASGDGEADEEGDDKHHAKAVDLEAKNGEKYRAHAY